jgi:hypothetical protein
MKLKKIFNKGVVMDQIHNNFKMFTAQYAKGIGLDQLLREIEGWVKTNKVAPKSIGIEFLEDTKTLIMSIGYRNDEQHEITLNTALIGKLDIDNLTKCEKDIEEAISGLKDIICHELFVTDEGLLHMIFMCKK